MPYCQAFPSHLRISHALYFMAGGGSKFALNLIHSIEPCIFWNMHLKLLTIWVSTISINVLIMNYAIPAFRERSHSSGLTELLPNLLKSTYEWDFRILSCSCAELNLLAKFLWYSWWVTQVQWLRSNIINVIAEIFLVEVATEPTMSHL